MLPYADSLPLQWRVAVSSPHKYVSSAQKYAMRVRKNVVNMKHHIAKLALKRVANVLKTAVQWLPKPKNGGRVPFHLRRNLDSSADGNSVDGNSVLRPYFSTSCWLLKRLFCLVGYMLALFFHGKDY